VVERPIPAAPSIGARRPPTLGQFRSVEIQASSVKVRRGRFRLWLVGVCSLCAGIKLSEVAGFGLPSVDSEVSQESNVQVENILGKGSTLENASRN
jgi:hypothetical protein